MRFRGCAPQVYLRLGRFALDRGDRSQALVDFETLLAETRSEIESFRDCLPLPDRILHAPAQPARPGAPPAAQWKVASETDNEGCRLLAIRESPAGFSPAVRKSKNGLRNSQHPSRGSGQSTIQGIEQGPSWRSSDWPRRRASVQRLSRASPRWRWKRKKMTDWVDGPVIL